MTINMDRNDPVSMTLRATACGALGYAVFTAFTVTNPLVGLVGLATFSIVNDIARRVFGKQNQLFSGLTALGAYAVTTNWMLTASLPAGPLAAAIVGITLLIGCLTVRSQGN